MLIVALKARLEMTISTVVAADHLWKTDANPQPHWLGTGHPAARNLTCRHIDVFR
jgi:hypothetical protein